VVAYANLLLEEEELLGLPRGTLFLWHGVWDLIPPTQRAQLPEETMQRLLRLKTSEWERIGDARHRVTAAMTLSLGGFDPGPMITPDRAAAQRGIDAILGNMERFAAEQERIGSRGRGALGWEPPTE